MAVYGFLMAKTNPTIARLGTALWYGLVLVAVLFCLFTPQAEFRYGYL
jgi:hypothetical protein